MHVSELYSTELCCSPHEDCGEKSPLRALVYRYDSVEVESLVSPLVSSEPLWWRLALASFY